MSLRLGAQDLAAIAAHVTGAYPEEGCGVLLGRDEQNARVVTAVLPFDNVRADGRERRYLIAPEQFLEAEGLAREHGVDVIGFFHSHPDHPARPSAFDLEHAWPYYSYVIVSVARGRIAGVTTWRLAEDRSRFDPEPLDAPDVAPATASAHGEDE